MLNYCMKHIIFLTIVLFLTACSHLSDLEIAQQSKEKNIVVIVPLQSNSTDPAHKVREKLAKEPRLYVVTQKEIEELLETNTLKHFNGTDENKAIQIAKRVRAQTVLFSTFEKPLHHIKKYQLTKTKCLEGECWQIKVSCKSNTASLSSHLKIVDLSTSSLLFDGNISKNRRWEVCADETVGSKSVQSQLDALSTEIANETASVLLEAL